MTNLQLLLTIGIPSLLVVLSWMSNNKRLDKIEADIERRFAEVDRRFADVDRRFTEMDRKFAEMDRRFADMDRRFDTVIDSQHRDSREILRNMTSLHERVAVVEAKAA
jgi:hypothetical protein